MYGETQPTLIGRRTLLQGIGAVGLGVAGIGATAGVAQAASYSQNGFPVITSSSSAALDRNFHVGKITFPAGVRTGNPHVILHFVAKQFNAHVERLYNPGCWGYNYKYISGSTTYSNHASGTAIDCNAPDHPRHKKNTFTKAQRKQIHAILNFCDGVVRWGGTYSDPDDMHFEIVARWKSPSIGALADKIRARG